jgi:hypothetical protein
MSRELRVMLRNCHGVQRPATGLQRSLRAREVERGAFERCSR